MVWSPYTKDFFEKLEAVQHRLLRYCSIKLNNPMYFFDHNYEPLMTYFNLIPINDLFRYYDLTTAYNIVLELFNCHDRGLLFTTRDVSYSIRNPRPNQEVVYPTNYTYYFPIARLRRAWNTLPQFIRDASSISCFKRLVKASIVT